MGVSSVAGDRGRQSNYYCGVQKRDSPPISPACVTDYFCSGAGAYSEAWFVRTQMTAGMAPALLTASPEAVAHDVFKAQQKTKDILYTRWYWRIILGIFKILPERVFKRLKT